MITRILRKFAKAIKSPFAETVLVLGDSHAEAFDAFSAYQLLFKLPKYQFHVGRVGGATALGLKNPHSKTKALEIFERELNAFPGKKVVVILGEVDIGSAIWIKMQTKNISLDEALGQAIGNYIDFIKQIDETFDVTVLSAPLPTLNEKNAKGEVAVARKNVSASQKERTELTLLFNNKIQSFCVGKKISYINLDDQSLGDDGLVNSALMNPNPLDHHYDKSAYCVLLAESLNRL